MPLYTPGKAGPKNVREVYSWVLGQLARVSLAIEEVRSNALVSQWNWIDNFVGDPGTGNVSGNATQMADMTVFNLSVTDRNGNDLPDTHAQPGDVLLFLDADRTAYGTYQIVSTTDNVTWRELDVVPDAGNTGNPATGNVMEIAWIPQATVYARNVITEIPGYLNIPHVAAWLVILAEFAGQIDIVFGRNNITPPNGYLDIGGVRGGSWVCPGGADIASIGISRGDVGAASFEILVNGVVMATVPSSALKSFQLLDIPILNLDTVQVRSAAGGSPITNVVVSLIIKRNITL